MPGGGARRGRRDNGLVAQEYTVVGDVDPRVGEHLLDMLAEGGIAAYLQPASDLHPLTRTTTLPARPTDRLYVDRDHLATAQDYLARLTAAVPEQPTPAESTAPVSDEDAFAAIVAGFHTTVDPTRAVPWPAAEDLESSSTAAPDMDTEPAPRTSLRRPSDAVDRSLLDSLDTFGTDLPDEPEEDEGYTPPPPPPLPRVAPVTILAVLALGAGLVLLFWPDLLPLGAQTTLFLGFAGVLTGFVTLVLRLRPGDEEDDDPDNGARV
ncbi:DUF308 domain-containing protein [Dactylosporangium sp. NPDC051541]|uniref:DUF308 domain-containing protein n=1 Tax=Dactylosporangium sp. NPDC051541 TaxID=3363977 RepID=UPI00379763E4